MQAAELVGRQASALLLQIRAALRPRAHRRIGALLGRKIGNEQDRCKAPPNTN